MPETLAYAMAAVTEPTGGNIHTGSVTLIDFGRLVDGTAKTAVFELEVDTNATHGYSITVVGDATLLNIADSSDSISAVSGTNASPAAWPTVDSSTTAAWGYHSSDEALLAGTSGRFSSADTYGAFSSTPSVVSRIWPYNV